MSKRRVPLSNRPVAAASGSDDVLADILDTLRPATLVYGRLELGAPWGVRVPAMGCVHLYIVARGGGRLEFEDGTPVVQFAAGDALLLPQSVDHTLRDGKGSPVLVLGEGECREQRSGGAARLGGNGAQTTLVAGAFLFAAGGRSPLLEGLKHTIHLPALGPQASPWLPSVAQMLVAESASTHPGSRVVVNRLFEVLFVQILRSHMSTEDCANQGLRAVADSQIGRALSLMHQQPGKDWTVESLATAAGLSRSGFAARFLALVGDAPLEYLTAWRMTKAAALLRDRSSSLGQVAEQVGYQSEASFNRAFKRHHGITPGAFRRQQRPA